MKVSSRIQSVLEVLDQTRGLYYNIAKPTADLLFFLTKLKRPQTIIEIGTANGYSSIVMGAAIQSYGGNVITIERNGRLVEEARENIMEAGLQDVVTVYPGSAYKVIQKLSGPFDMVFNDGTKQEYLGYFERFYPKLSPQALVIANGAISNNADLSKYTNVVFKDELLSSNIVPVGRGLLVSVYEPKKEPNFKKPVSSIGELVVEVEKRYFKGTASQVKNGEIFIRKDKAEPKNERDGYVDSLITESMVLPTEEEVEPLEIL